MIRLSNQNIGVGKDFFFQRSLQEVLIATNFFQTGSDRATEAIHLGILLGVPPGLSQRIPQENLYSGGVSAGISIDSFIDCSGNIFNEISPRIPPPAGTAIPPQIHPWISQVRRLIEGFPKKNVYKDPCRIVTKDTSLEKSLEQSLEKLPNFLGCLGTSGVNHQY